MSNNFCVYEHWRSDKNAPFYVGKGSIKRANGITRKENQRHLRVVKKVIESGHRIYVVIVARDLDEAEAFAVEIKTIANHRANGVDIVNMTDGGEGASGCVLSAETRAKMSRSRTGKIIPAARGRKLTEEHKAKISPRGRVLSDETKAKISAAQKGKHRPELVGRKFSESTLERMRNRVFTEEHRRRISEAKKGKSYVKDRQRAAAQVFNPPPSAESLGS